MRKIGFALLREEIGPRNTLRVIDPLDLVGMVLPDIGGDPAEAAEDRAHVRIERPIEVRLKRGLIFPAFKDVDPPGRDPVRHPGVVEATGLLARGPDEFFGLRTKL